MNRQSLKVFVFLLSASILMGCSLPGKFKLGKKDNVPSNKAIGNLNNPEKFTLSYAKWQEQQGQIQEAQESYSIVLSEYPENKQAKLGLARVNTRLGNLPEAEETLKQLLKEAPNDAEVLDAVAQLYAEKGDWPRALALLDQAVTLKPDDQTYRYHHAVALAEFGKVRESLQEFRSVLPESEANFNLAVVLKRKGDLRGAEYHVAQALALDPKYPEAKKFYQELQAGANNRYANHASNRYQQPTQPAGYQSPVTPPYQGTAEYQEESRGPFEQ